MDNKNKKTTKATPNNVLKFNNVVCATLSEQERNNLFLGFVRLIKRSVVLQKENQYKAEINYCNKRITEYLQELDKKNTQIMDLQNKIELLTNSGKGSIS